ncbi:uncharacterized protein LODBEIA_P49980 [Lodderomyces beijingensis]|uniref:Survival protein SurE-like phosphatase/nucleotidase domain-containing protein n=1 Tax=Lodderomyces beijingensis TaxID=1775926 RepID=A0ABP0ZS83_9ASCO
MHVLLTNDDGPINNHSCPYMKYFVDEIKTSTDWDLSIVIPDQQRSWIGKAHFAGKTLVATYIYTKYSTASPNPHVNAYEGPFDHPVAKYSNDSEYQEWCLINSTPAACADIGIHHLYRHSKDKPVDLVISGPNFGKNSSNLYILASGTVGAAMEAVTHGVKAIALSYAFNSLDHDFRNLKEAAKISVKLVQKLYAQLDANKEIDLFSVNVPLVDSLKLGETKIYYAPIFQNTWASIYAPAAEPNARGQLEFHWAPNFKQVYKDGLSDQAHTDSRVLLNEGVSVTPMKAAFRALDTLVGEIDLSNDNTVNEKRQKEAPVFLITIPKESYLYKPLVAPFAKLGYRISSDSNVIRSSNAVFHYGEYEQIDLDAIHRDNYFISSYIYRKALIRKHYLANTVRHYITKKPQSVLARAVPENYQLELDYAEFLDDALDEVPELRDAVEPGRDWWIVKPAMADGGQGIGIVKTLDQLQSYFDSFGNDDDDEEHEEGKGKEEELDDDDDDSLECDEVKGDNRNRELILSQLRHFIIQRYVSNPLLLSDYNNKKSHLRVYVLAQGNINVFVYRNILTLFAGQPYTANKDEIQGVELSGHLTNTCLQAGDEVLVVPFWKLQGITKTAKVDIFSQICEITREVFTAAATVDKFNFQPLDNAVEFFGVDFLVDSNFQVHLLEVNSYPDFKQTGEELKDIIFELFDLAATEVIHPMLSKSKIDKYSKNLHKVL